MQPDDHDVNSIALKLSEIAIEAGRVLRRMECAFIEKRIKDDGSPTTLADLAAEELIMRRLGEAWPAVPVVAEETASGIQPDRYFFLVDPLDGTGDFIHGTGEYSVNIALVQAIGPWPRSYPRPPWVGSGWRGDTTQVADIPAQDRMGLDWQPIQARPAPERDLVALVSRRHGDNATETCLSALSIGTRRMTSSALKFCLHRLRRGRHLCALRPDHGMGYGGGRSHPEPCRRSA